MGCGVAGRAPRHPRQLPPRPRAPRGGGRQGLTSAVRGDSLTFYTGAGWLGGSAVGGAIGVAQGASARTELPGGAAAKRRVNTLLNKTFSHGRGFGNALGALGLLYAGLDSLIAYATDEKLRDDVNSIAAAAAAGAVYRSGAGPRSAAVAALFGGAAAGALHGASWAAGGFR